jgi:tetratricopeptide (TPR) repeat protein
MKTKILTFWLALMCLGALAQSQQGEKSVPSDLEKILEGEWVRISHFGPISMHFKTDGTVEGDLGRDNSVDVVSSYTIENNTLTFRDLSGVSCPGKGIYEVQTSDYYLSLDLITDDCGGRLRSTMGFWVRPDFADRMEPLSEKIAVSANPDNYINRARMYMAIGKSEEAKQDLDQYIKHDSSDARAYINRAGTQFPSDMKGVVMDCNRALNLDPDSKNAYFLRGLARYQMGKKKEACDDFHKAIELGFTVLKEAEKARCLEFWKSYVTE